MVKMDKELYNKDMLMVLTARFLENEYGEGALKALVEWKNEKNRDKWRKISENTGRNDPGYLLRLFNENVHDFTVLREDPEALEVIVNCCAHAENFAKFNANETGFKMICMGDFAVVEGFNPEILFTRSKTLMNGDKCCHFSFKLKNK